MHFHHDYLPEFSDQLDIQLLHSLRQEAEQKLYEPKNSVYRSLFAEKFFFKTLYRSYATPSVEIGSREELSPEQANSISFALQKFKPWKKGPFKIFDTMIDSEWRSDWKWDRILPQVTSLENQVVADIGCHNGYYMFRMLAEHPKLVIGFEPVAKHWYTFQWIQNFSQEKNLFFEMLGVESIQHFHRFFDTIFCLGILYHLQDPILALRKMHHSLKQNGEIILDCQGIPGDEEICLTPANRYAHATGVWFLPTFACLKNWLLRTNFRDVYCFYAAPLSFEEQRPTSWAQVLSLRDFLDEKDPTKTKEGYPAPWRFYVKARKG